MRLVLICSWLGNSMVKLSSNGRRVLSSYVAYYYFEFTQALVRIITFYLCYITALAVFQVLQLTNEHLESLQHAILSDKSGNLNMKQASSWRSDYCTIHSACLGGHLRPRYDYRGGRDGP